MRPILLSTIFLAIGLISNNCQASISTTLLSVTENTLEYTITNACNVLKILPFFGVTPDVDDDICKLVKSDRREAEAYLTTLELLKYRGYPAEAHKVQTDDGYILEIHRIPHGRSGPSPDKRPPILLQHGYQSSSEDYLINFGNQSLGYMLADVGYDVWLGNYRGNTYSRKHVTLDPDDEKFWRFSFHEHGRYDLAATIDYVLNKTNSNKLSYVGYSMGTTGFFALMSNRTEYNDKVKVMAALAPVVIISPESTSREFITADFLDVTQSVGDVLNIYAIGQNPTGTENDLTPFCSPNTEFCHDLIMFAAGYEPNPKQLNESRIPVYTSHFPAGSSTQVLYNFAQLAINPNTFRAFDHNSTVMNKRMYGQPTPPVYNLSTVTTPVGLFWGKNDQVAIPSDVALLAKSLGNVVLNHQIADKLWNHVDFIFAIEAEKYQNTHIVNFLAQYL